MSDTEPGNSDFKDGRDPADMLAACLGSAGTSLTRLPGRRVRQGLHEVKELGPALKSAFEKSGLPGRPELNYIQPIRSWTRPTTQVDFVVLENGGGRPRLAAELKVWDIGHQLFDLAKVSCLLLTGLPSGFLVCVAQRDADFERKVGGVLFPRDVGETRKHRFSDLIDEYRAEWRCHVGKGGPEPTAVPTAVATQAIASPVSVAAYPGHSARAVQVTVVDPTPVDL